jgi:uncharacterized membrane protein
MNLSALFYLVGAALALLVGFGVIDAVHGQVVWGWVAVGLLGLGLLVQSFGDRRLG